jgi:hypothetical protein
MDRDLPSLNALRALEAAGRLGSFTRAAEELAVTPGAISRRSSCWRKASASSFSCARAAD